jgi:hypothetical protein
MSWIFGYRSVFWYATFVAIFVFPAWEPTTADGTGTFYFAFVLVSIFYFVLQAAAMLTATVGKNVTREIAVLGDAGVSLFVFVVHLAAVISYAAGWYVPSPIDLQFLVISGVIGLADIIIFTVMMVRANRRGSEVNPEV